MAGEPDEKSDGRYQCQVHGDNDLVYLFGSGTDDNGYDCWGIARYIFNQIGYVLSFELAKLDAAIPVYNIEVDNLHTYFVGDGNGWVLVNKFVIHFEVSEIHLLN